MFHRRMIHGSLPNKSNELRWSMDLRYLPVGQPTGYPQLPGFVLEAGPTLIPNCGLRNSGIRPGWTAANAWWITLSRHYTLDGAQTTRSATSAGRNPP